MKVPYTPKCPLCLEEKKFLPDKNSISGYIWKCPDCEGE
jgi:hypothetical protein